MRYAYQQTFRPQQSRNNLAPGFLSRSNQQFVTLVRAGLPILKSLDLLAERLTQLRCKS